jgi:hypothetical protein
MRKVKPGQVDARTERVGVPAPPDGYISFSFRYYARTRKFGVSDCVGAWFESLFDRLQALSSLQPQEVRSNRSNALRAHPIDFSRTSEPDGFSHLNPHLRSYEPYQFQLSKATGRVHGFFIELVFYVVWLDPHHRLYS